MEKANPPHEEVEKKWKDRIVVATIFIFSVGGFILLRYWPFQDEIKPSEIPDYIAIKSFSYVSLAENLTSHAEDPKNIVGWVNKTLLPQGKFGRMYVFLEASVDNGKPLTAYDDLYITFEDKGGHISPGDSLQTPPGEISTLLYSGASLPYTILNSGKKHFINLLDLFDNGKEIKVLSFLSTARSGGNISKLGIYYECASKDSKCSIVSQ